MFNYKPTTVFLREDYLKEIKSLAVEVDSTLKELVNEAVGTYLEKAKKAGEVDGK